LPTLSHIFDDIEYTVGYTYYRGNGTPEDPEDFDIIQIWNEHEDPVSEDLFDQILCSCDMVELIREDMKNDRHY
jgi:hypothetical protein